MNHEQGEWLYAQRWIIHKSLSVGSCMCPSILWMNLQRYDSRLGIRLDEVFFVRNIRSLLSKSNTYLKFSSLASNLSNKSERDENQIVAYIQNVKNSVILL